MGRGLGPRQRSILLSLNEADKPLLPWQLRQRIGSRDRPNTRRRIRELEARDLVAVGEDRRVRLTGRGRLRAAALTLQDEPDPWPELRRRDEEWQLFEEIVREVRAEKRRRRREKLDRYPWWYSYSRLTLRKEGPNQLRILACLWWHSDPLSTGLPVTVVKRICELEPANGRRAIRGLLADGYLDELPGGERIRLSKELVLHYREDWPIVAFPILHLLFDEDRTREILREYGEDVGEGLPLQGLSRSSVFAGLFRKIRRNPSM